MTDRNLNRAPSAAEEKMDAAKSTPMQEDQPPTGRDHWELIQRFQARAMQRADPLTANLEVLSGDMMAFPSP